jgi:potassium-transporting ATPase KdpC subunit
MREAVRFVKLIVALVLVLGLVYPLSAVLVARIWSNKADGQIVLRDGEAVGAREIGQEFTSDGFFHGRPSAAGSGYDAMHSGASNLAVGNYAQTVSIEGRIEELLRENPDLRVDEIPVELVTASASGLDPDISPGSAILQVARISHATGIAANDLEQLVEEHTSGRFLGIFGERRVNVLELNLEVLKMMEEGKQ